MPTELSLAHNKERIDASVKEMARWGTANLKLIASNEFRFGYIDGEAARIILEKRGVDTSTDTV